MAHAPVAGQDRDKPDQSSAGHSDCVPEQPVVIVLCGGTSRRFGEHDKTRQPLAGTTVLDHLLDSLPWGWAVVCVGRERATNRSVQWCRESPAGGGPVAGIAAGLDHLGAEISVVVGGDMPFAAAVLPRLVDALITQPDLDAVLAVDPDGRRQPLLAAYRFDALRVALPRKPDGSRLMAVIDAMVVGVVRCEAGVSLDVDTPEALEQARKLAGGAADQ